MATRPIYTPTEKYPYVKEIMLEFEWHAGFAKSQAQKSIFSLHNVAREEGISPILEISSKSLSPLGEQLSAFNLLLHCRDESAISVECAFQGSKVFTNGGPYTDLYNITSREAKQDDRLKTSGRLIGFNFMGEDFPTIPQTAFYDWLYINALFQHRKLAGQLLHFSGFSDIAFNPGKSINCQARSAALFVALSRNGLIEVAMQSRDTYLAIISGGNPNLNKGLDQQLELPWES